MDLPLYVSETQKRNIGIEFHTVIPREESATSINDNLDTPLTVSQEQYVVVNRLLGHETLLWP